MTSFTWICYKEVIFEGKKTSTLNHNFAFTSTLMSQTKDAHKIAYTKWQVKSWTCYLTTKKEVYNYF
jgi:hypothetical protein